MLRSYVSDEFDFRYIEQDYEKRDKSRPYFMFNVTMQNHSPYTLYSSELKDRIKLRGLTGNYPLTEQYLALIRRSDDAFRQLLKYFDTKNEKFMVFFAKTPYNSSLHNKLYCFRVHFILYYQISSIFII